jgi:hypothetical protein
MKNLFPLIVAFIPLLVNAQDRLIMSDQVSKEIVVTRMNADTLFFRMGENTQAIAYAKFKSFQSTDKFKKFLYENPDVFKSNNIDLQFTNYCLERYRRQSNAGRGIMFAGIGITMVSAIYMQQSDLNNINTSYGIAIAGYAVTLLGLVIDLNANHWLKNITVTGSYQPGLGYVFKF